MSLREYARKRDFARTAEPKGEKAATHPRALRFVIQKHDASRLHYDFRLELEGALKSWAVPKGPPYARGEKRLAMHVEDHPLDYAGFEGIIPKGQYGGGTVMVWDTGTYEPLSEDPAGELAGGKLHFLLHGKKLEGEWSLVRIRGESGNEWLLIKNDTSVEPVSKKHDDESVLTGRSMAQIAAARDAEWQSDRAETVKPKRVAAKAALPAPAAKFIEPMAAKVVAAPPLGDWLYELKFDGFRALAIKHGREVQLLSRNNKDLAGKFPEVVEAVRTIAAPNFFLDGEIVAVDEQGRSSFQLLQQYEMGEERPPLFYYAFDLLQLGDRDLRERPLRERKDELERLLAGAPETIRYSAPLGGDVHHLLAEIKARGLEGVIGKRPDSHYESGRRSGAWIKLKCVNEQEFVIGGYTPPAGTRRHFGALLVGYFEGVKLKFAGKVGTGFNTAGLKALFARFQPLRRATCPFANLPERQAGRWSQGITPAEMKRCTWVDPRMVCQVKFSEWTSDAKLRHPVFLGLREDKEARAVMREVA